MYYKTAVFIQRPCRSSQPWAWPTLLQIPLFEQRFREIHLPLYKLCSLYRSPILPLSQLFQVRLIRAISDSNGPDMCPHCRQWCVLTYALGAICLHCFIDDFKRHVWNEDLGLCDLHESGFGVASVDRGGCVENDEAGGVDVDAGLGYPVQDYTLF